MKYEVIVNGKAAELRINGGRFRYQRATGEVVESDYSLAAAGSGTHSLLIGGRSYTVSPLGGGEFSVNAQTFHLEIIDPRNMRGRKTAGAAEGRQKVAAAMPGRVIRLLVQAGQEVAAGEGLIVVEAMKMQNEMKSPKAGRVAEIKTAPGATVSAGEILMVID